jgi:hypothetical protein
MSKADLSNAEYFPHYVEILQRESGEQNAEHVTSRQVQEDVAELSRQVAELRAEMKAEMKLEVAELRAEMKLQNEKMLDMMATLLAQQPKQTSPANVPSKFHSVVGQVMAQSRADQKGW